VGVDREIVTAFPKLRDFQQVTPKMMGWDELDKRLVIKEAELLDNRRSDAGRPPTRRGGLVIGDRLGL